MRFSVEKRNILIFILLSNFLGVLASWKVKMPKTNFFLFRGVRRGANADAPSRTSNGPRYLSILGIFVQK